MSPRGNAGPAPVNRAVATTNNDALTQVVTMMNRDDRQAQFVALLGSREMFERFKNVALHALASNSAVLKDCTPASIVEAIRESAVLGLEPTGLLGEAWILPYGATAKLQPGYLGYLKLLRRAVGPDGQIIVGRVSCAVVYENDYFVVTHGNNAGIDHRPVVVRGKAEDGTPLHTRGDIVGVYAAVYWRDGRLMEDPEYMTTAEVNEIMARSPSVRAQRSSPWDTDWGEMARKTVLRRLEKRLRFLYQWNPQLQLASTLDAEADEFDRQQQAPPSTQRSIASDAAAAALRARGEEPVAPVAAIAAPAGDLPTQDVVEPVRIICGADAPAGYQGGPCTNDPHAEGLHRNASRESWA